MFINIVQTIVEFTTLRFENLKRKLRYAYLNNTSQISISKYALLHKTVDLQVNIEPLSSQIQIHDNVCIMQGVIIAPYGGKITIDENVFIGPYCVLYGHGNLLIGKNTLIAAHSVLIPANHVFVDCQIPIRNQPLSKRGISIGEDVWIGCGVKILDGVSIGKGCVIGAGAVVTRSLPDYSVAVGIPAKIISRRDKSKSSNLRNFSTID